MSKLWKRAKVVALHEPASRFTISASNPTLNKPTTAGGSMKIANEVIEEVDEQATITSMAMRHESRPTAMSLFQKAPQPSEPVNINNSKNSNHSSNTRLSSSAPNPWGHSRAGVGDKSPAAESLGTQGSFSMPDSLPDESRPRLDSDVGPSLSAAGSQTLLDEVDGENDDVDDFERLRSKREKERREKYRQKLMARSVSAQQRTGSVELIDNDLLLEDLLMQSGALKKEDIKDSTKEDTT